MKLCKTEKMVRLSVSMDVYAKLNRRAKSCGSSSGRLATTLIEVGASSLPFIFAEGDIAQKSLFQKGDIAQEEC